MDKVTPPAPRALTLDGTRISTVGRLRVYVCGVTPYDVTHLGHAATFLWTDVAARVARATGSEVELTRNVTDVDETLLAEARRRGEPYDWLAARQRFAFDRTMAALRVRRPDHEPTARQAIAQVVQLCQALLDVGAAYVRGSSVYARAADTAARAGLDEQRALALAAEYGDDPHDADKEHPLDVAVWVGAAEGEVSWPGPWGAGRPGWHAQCAAMVLATYGASIDVHAGGADLTFPHHAAEAHLAETVTGVRPFARAWLHPGTVYAGGSKMAKSTGNLVLVDELLATHAPAAVRLLCLDRPWRDNWSYDDSALDAAAARLDQLYGAAGKADATDAAVRAVEDALLDDLDVPRAIETALDAGGAAARRLVDICQLQ